MQFEFTLNALKFKFKLMQCVHMYIHNKVNKWSKELKQYSPHSSSKFHPGLRLHWSWYQLMCSSLLWFRSKLSSTQLMLDGHSWFDGFQKQNTEALIELTIYIFTYLLLDYIQYYVQYLHIVARVLIYYMLCPWLHFFCLNYNVSLT